MLLPMILAALSPFLENVTAPVEVAVQPTYAARDLCRLDSGEIRHYGRKLVDGAIRTVYISSSDGYNWTTHLAAEDDPGAMVKIPWSGTWFALKGGYEVGRDVKSLRCYRSKTGPGDVRAEKTVLLERGSYELRQTAFLPDRRRIVCALSDTQTYAKRGNDCYHATVMYSDDDAKTWKMVDVPAIPDVPRLAPGDRMPHWFNDGCEPSLVAMKDGSLRMMVRTSGPYAGFLESRDGSETWRVLPCDRRFWQANTMPLLARLSDGRLLAVWNNTAMLPTRDPKEYPELDAGARQGRWETVFTNRDALHAAISDDEGKTWRGFRELILCGPRNNADFRQLGNAQDQEHDKSVHQTQLLELEKGKVLLALGQNAAARRMIVFDPNWLLETERHDDFRHGFAGLSNHLYVRSLAGGARGWAGHCAFNRVPGALLVRDPETTPATKRELLQLCRVRDPRLLSDRQGIVWNFPAAETGFVELDVRIAKSGFRLTLADHWMNPCDETGPSLAPFTCAVTKDLIGPRWCRLRAAFDGTARTVKLSVDGRLVKEFAYTGANPAPLSYLHLQTLAEETDTEGTYFRSFDMKADRATAGDRIPVIDITGDAARQVVIAAGTKDRYEGHPTTLLADDGKTMFCVWTTGHGGPCGQMARSDDGGLTWTRLDATLPAVYSRTHRNCPTLQKAKLADGRTRYLIFSAKIREGSGLGILASDDAGRTWYEAPCQKHLSACMPPTGFMPLKDGTLALFGQVRKNTAVKTDRPTDDQDVWMSVSTDGGLTWGPARTVAAAEKRNLCEPCCLRSPDGNSLVLLMRENRHKGRSMMCFSRDEGKTWSEPVDTAWELTGDRHEGVLLPDGRYVIAFRDQAVGSPTRGQYVAWVGTWEDIEKGRPGQFRIYLIRHYYRNRFPGSNGDSGYSGVELLPDGTIVATTYARYFPDGSQDDGRQSSVVSARFKIDELKCN